MKTSFVNLYNEESWYVEDIFKVVTLVREYADKNKLSGVKLVEVEDNTYSDPKNERFDVTIMYTTTNGSGKQKLIIQKLLILKGEILDGEEFHKRFKEFY